MSWRSLREKVESCAAMTTARGERNRYMP